MEGDHGLVEVARRLWRPFESPAPAEEALRIRLERVEQGWSVGVEGDEPIVEENPWDALDEMRYGMVEEAVARAEGVVCLHAGVVARGERAIVLPAASKAGKTSLTVALVEAGWDYVSDDLAPLRATGGTPELIAFPKPLGLRRPEVIARYRGSWQVPEWMGEPAGTLMLPPDVLRTTSHTVLTPAGLVFPQFQAGAEPTMKELSPAQAAALCGRFVHQVDESVLASLVRLCRDVPSAAITYGSTEHGITMFGMAVARTEAGT